MKLFKQKDWEIISETTTESQMEQSLRLTGECPSPRNEYQFRDMTARKHIVILKCKNTGKIKKMVENI